MNDSSLHSTKERIGLYLKLWKLRVVVLLQITAVCAILTHDILSWHGIIDIKRTYLDTVFTIVITILGGTLAAGGSNAINMWYDRDIDPLMRRTENRPLPNGQIKPNHALLFGITSSIIGSSLFLLIHWKAAFWSFFSVMFYVFIYTIWLKRRSPQNIVIGGIAGSTPPLIGWACAASESLSGMNPFDLGSPIPWMLFLLIFLWTPPHFWALALYRSGEYAKAKIPMMNEVKGPEHAIMLSKLYCIGLISLSLVPVIWPEAGLTILWGIITAGISIWYAQSVWSIDITESFDENNRMPSASHSFFRSLIYLGLMFLSLVFVVIIPPDWLGPLGVLS